MATLYPISLAVAFKKVEKIHIEMFLTMGIHVFSSKTLLSIVFIYLSFHKASYLNNVQGSTVLSILVCVRLILFITTVTSIKFNICICSKNTNLKIRKSLDTTYGSFLNFISHAGNVFQSCYILSQVIHNILSCINLVISYILRNNSPLFKEMLKK